MHRVLLNLVLLGVVLVLAAVLYFGGEDEDVDPPLTALSPAAIESITLAQTQGATLRLQKRDGRWQLIEPVQTPAEAAQAERLAALATTPVRSRLDDAGLDLAALGLAPPRFTLALDDQRLEFGMTEPLSGRRYVRRDGEVLLIDDPAGELVDGDYADLVARRLLPPGKTLVGIQTPAMQLQRDAEGSWTSVQQPAAPAEQLRATADAWAAAEALWTDRADAGAEGEAEGEGEPVILRFADGSERRLLVLDREPQLVLADPQIGVRYTLAGDLAAKLLEPPAAQPAAGAAS